MTLRRKGRYGLTRTMGALILSAALASQAAYASTYMPACYKPAPNNPAILKYPAKKGPYRIALVNGYTGIPWREQMIKSVRVWAAQPEIAAQIKELKIVSTGSDVASQNAAIDNYNDAGFDAVFFDAVNPSAFGGVIRHAEKIGTILVSFDNPVDSPKIMRITPNWIDFEMIKTEAVVRDMARIQGTTQPKGTILEVRGPQGNSTDRDRHIGVENVLEAYPGIKAIEVVGNWDTGTVQKVTSDALAVYGKFDGIVCQYGCQGVINALNAAGVSGVPIGGDGTNGFIKGAVAGHFPGISVVTSPGQGPVALRATLALLEGKELPELANLPSPHKDLRDMKSGVDYFPDMPDTFAPITGYAACGSDMVFTPDQLNAAGAANN